MRLSALALLMTAMAAGRAGATCPNSATYAVCDPGPTLNSLPAYQRECERCTLNGCAYMIARYDIPNGTLYASVSIAGDTGGGASVTMEDDFVVVGPPAGTPVQLVAHMAAWVSRNGLGYPMGSATLSDMLGHSVDATLPGETDLTLAVSCLAGQPFRLRYKVVASGTYQGDGYESGTISFSDLPAGAVVRSCNGYQSPGVVRSRLSSWGTVKSSYR